MRGVAEIWDSAACASMGDDTGESGTWVHRGRKIRRAGWSVNVREAACAVRLARLGGSWARFGWPEDEFADPGTVSHPMEMTTGPAAGCGWSTNARERHEFYA